MTTQRFKTAIALLDRFESQYPLQGTEAEALVAAILRACGHEVTNSGFIGSDTGVDCFFEANLDGRKQRVGVEIMVSRQPAGVASVAQAIHLRGSGHFDRTMVISRAGFTQAAQMRADALAAGEVDLFSPKDLRNWLYKHAAADSLDPTSINIIREAMKRVALRLAQHPHELATIEWRQLEQLLREVFEGLGFETRLTRPGRDGGFDLELVSGSPAGAQHHLIEVKHWAEQRPGARHLTKLVKVTAERKAAGALLLSTSGFTKTIYSGLVEFSAPVRLADGEKVISLCRAFYRLSTGFWLPDNNLEATLYNGTNGLGQ